MADLPSVVVDLEKTAKAAKKLAKFDAQLGSLKQALQGSWTNHQAGSEDGLEYETVLQRAKDSCTSR